MTKKETREKKSVYIKKKKKARCGRKPFSTKAMTAAETQKRYRINKRVKALRNEKTRQKVLEEFNVFGPQIEARKFVALLAENEGKLIRTMKQWQPSLSCKSNDVIFDLGMEMCKRDTIKDLINEELNSSGVTVNKVVSDIYNISQDMTAKHGDKLRALELLGKFKKIFSEEEDRKNIYNLNLDEGTARRLLERRNIIEGEYGGEGSTAVDTSAEECDGEYGEEESDRLLNSDAEEL